MSTGERKELTLDTSQLFNFRQTKLLEVDRGFVFDHRLLKLESCLLEIRKSLYLLTMYSHMYIIYNVQVSDDELGLAVLILSIAVCVCVLLLIVSLFLYQYVKERL